MEHLSNRVKTIPNVVQLVADLQERIDQDAAENGGFVPITFTVDEAELLIGALKERYALP